MKSPPTAAPVSRWEPGELTPPDALAQLTFLIHGALERRAADHELSIIQLRLLGVLRDRAPTMKQLARLLALDKSSITGLVDRAERRGLVTRTPSPVDRRSVLVRLTEHGRSLATGAARGFQADVSTMLNPLSDSDRDALTRSIARMLVADAEDRGVDLFDTIDTHADA